MTLKGKIKEVPYTSEDNGQDDEEDHKSYNYK